MHKAKTDSTKKEAQELSVWMGKFAIMTIFLGLANVNYHETIQVWIKEDVVIK